LGMRFCRLQDTTGVIATSDGSRAAESIIWLVGVSTNLGF
jgi:hypothetical protein